MRIAQRIGVVSSIGTMILWIILVLLNPYIHERAENDVIINTLFTLFVPACVALLASTIKKPSLMFIAFVWSLPISLYMTMSPSIFKLFGVTSFMYLISGIVTIREIRSRQKQRIGF
ncbi:putative effector of murein hydrolase LrgA (UPF0299 family) [Paenibacillus sp. V4I9]|uniref:hypothetical protein n=1 Tax=Paenibacillus sp. V4I9 TaxID=3042308 RepID=UPI002786C927|nr:hypothetical protein [Paenibacillus sp. V4I9]MDQ0888770.1 putative effector of murein hydrolase LrgA (UPF0299 family) [Paenibacillus sp. V4I9]